MMSNTGVSSTNSLQTDDEYSFISRAQGLSIQAPFLNDKGQFADNEELQSSPISNGSIGDHEHIFTSYHALQTAYDHMKRRYSETVEIKNSLQRRLKVATAASSMDQASAVQFLAANHEKDVAKAWDAYSDKCKECEKLRDDLRAAEQKALKTQIDARDMSIREDMLRAKSQQDEYKKQLQEAELEIRDHKVKLEMAREDLEKEKEYLEMLRKSAEERHNKMESTISSLQQEVQIEKHKNQEFLKDFEKQRQNAQEMLEKRESSHKEELRKIEEKLFHERDERTMAENKLLELSTWKRDTEKMIHSSGIPLSLPLTQQQRFEREYEADSSSIASDIDAEELMAELHSLNEEITTLKKQATYQSSILSEIYRSPKVQESISVCNGFDGSENFNIIHPPQFNHMTGSSDASSEQSIDTRRVVDKSPLSADDQLMQQQTGENRFGSSSTLAVSRQIHSLVSSGLNDSGRNSPQKIEIPKMPGSLSDAFTNIRLHKASGDLLHAPPSNDFSDNPTLFFSALPETSGPVGDASHATITQPKSTHASQTSDGGTSSSSVDTLVENKGDSENDEKERLPPVSANDRPPLRYGTTTYGNQPASGYTMQALWPSAGNNIAGQKAPIWPPSGTSSFDVISDSPGSFDSGSGASLSKGAQEYTDYLQKTGAREFRVQQVNRPTSREPFTSSNQFLKHPSAIPTNRPVRMADAKLQAPKSNPNSSLPRRRAERRSSAVEQEEDDEKAFLAPPPSSQECPVCHKSFSHVTESFMQRHINYHFSDDDMDVSPLP